MLHAVLQVHAWRVCSYTHTHMKGLAFILLRRIALKAGPQVFRAMVLKRCNKEKPNVLQMCHIYRDGAQNGVSHPARAHSEGGTLPNALQKDPISSGCSTNHSLEFRQLKWRAPRSRPPDWKASSGMSCSVVPGMADSTGR
jgi:hypothetical protein